MFPCAKRLAPALLLLAAGPAAAEVPLDVIADFEIFIDGLFQADKNFFQDDVVTFKDDAEMRRAEVIFRAKHTNGTEIMLGYDPKADKWLDASVRYRLGPYTTVVAGQYKQPNSLEELGSTRNNDFIAKSMATNTFGVARRLGVGIATEHANWTATASYFGREITRNLARGSGYGGRVTWAPMLDVKPNGEADFLHLGLSAVSFDTDLDTLRLRSRPGADLTPIRLVDTGNLTRSDRITSIGAEAAWVHGPLHLQGEYYQAKVDRYVVDDFDASAWYVYGTYNLTGEGLGYKAGTVTTPFPNSPLSGMWQLGLRYESFDLDDGSVLGGEEKNTTVGVNYYWRTNFKFMVNYVDVQSERRNIEDNPSIVEVRAQLMF